MAELEIDRSVLRSLQELNNVMEFVRFRQAQCCYYDTCFQPLLLLLGWLGPKVWLGAGLFRHAWQ